jgi:hypothetical protein
VAKSITAHAELVMPSCTILVGCMLVIYTWFARRYAQPLRYDKLAVSVIKHCQLL